MSESHQCSHDHHHEEEHHAHSHHGGHHHHHGDLKGKNLFITVVLNLFITVAQIIGGVVSGSMALLSDALHNFSDVGALLISYYAAKISKKESNTSRTFGYKRAEILAALFNATVLVGIGIFLIIESVTKFFNPETIESSWVIWLALLSIILNFLSVLLLHKSSKDSLNIKSAYLHLLTDVMSSIALLIGGLCMMFFGWYFLDPLISIAIAVYLIYSSISLIKETVFMLMQFVPENIDVMEIVDAVSKLEGIANMHHVHVWSLSEKDIHLEAHVDFEENINLEAIEDQFEKINAIIKGFGITHITLQPCGRCSTQNIVCADA